MRSQTCLFVLMVAGCCGMMSSRSHAQEKAAVGFRRCPGMGGELVIKAVNYEFMTTLDFPDPFSMEIKTGGTAEALATICAEGMHCIETKAQVHFSEVKRKAYKGDFQIKLPDGREVQDHFDVHIKALPSGCA